MLEYLRPQRPSIAATVDVSPARAAWASACDQGIDADPSRAEVR